MGEGGDRQTVSLRGVSQCCCEENEQGQVCRFLSGGRQRDADPGSFLLRSFPWMDQLAHSYRRCCPIPQMIACCRFFPGLEFRRGRIGGVHEHNDGKETCAERHRALISC
jgi:hypothetical protein